MSEKGSLYSKLSHPHAGDPGVDPDARAEIAGKVKKSATKHNRRSKLGQPMSGPGLFFEEEPVVVLQSKIEQGESSAVVQVEAPLRERSIRLMQKSPMFEVKYNGEEVVIPRTFDQANDMFVGRLPMISDLKIDDSCLEKGKKTGTIIKCIGRSLFGAFTIALYPTTDEHGNDVNIPVLINMNDRKLRKDNEVQRFRRETSSLSYYASLPRVNTRRNS